MIGWLKKLLNRQPASPPAPVLTLILTYYNQGEMLKRQLKVWEGYPAELRREMQFLIVDDCSKVPARDVIGPAPKGLNLAIYRILEDKYCNIGGARNLGTQVAESEWMVHTDVDIIIPAGAAREMLSLARKNERKIYKFNRRFTDTGVMKIHPGTMLLTRTLYWEIGGCDEDFVGNYGQTDIHFFHRAKDVAETEVCQDIMMEHYGAGETEGIDRSKLEPNRLLFEEKKKTGAWSKDFLRFTWERQL